MKDMGLLRACIVCSFWPNRITGPTVSLDLLYPILSGTEATLFITAETRRGVQNAARWRLLGNDSTRRAKFSKSLRTRVSIDTQEKRR